MAKSQPGDSIVAPTIQHPNPEEPSTPGTPPVVEPVLPNSSLLIAVPVDIPKKSWASLLKTDGDNKVQGSLPTPAKPPTAYVVTSEEEKRLKAIQKSTRLGELLVAKKLLHKNLDRRPVFLNPRGMINRGNACYANAILQTLVFCPPFYHLLECLHLPENPSKDSAQELPPVITCLLNLAKEFKKIPYRPGQRVVLQTLEGPVDPGFVYDTLEEHGTSSQQSMLSRGRQEDAQEFLNHLLLLAHEEMLQGLGKLNMTLRSDNGTLDTVETEEWTHVKQGQKKSILRESDFKDSVVSHVFGGRLRSIRKHRGEKEFENVEPFFMLDLPIQDSRVNTVFQAIERFMGKEQIHGFVARGLEVRADRFYCFEELPAVLILHLKYFEYSQTGGLAKLQKTIGFDYYLRLPDRWFAEGHYNSAKSSYELSAVVFHWGEGTEGGHYTTCLCHPGAQGGWIEMNDSEVHLVNFEYVRSPQYHRAPYLLFYRQTGSGA